MLIDDCAQTPPVAGKRVRWRMIADGVMGGVSRGRLTHEQFDGRWSVRLTGRVSLDNQGGFIQMAIDLAEDGSAVDASGFDGVEIDVLGNDQAYNVHLRTADTVQPWQSYRCEFLAARRWQRLRLPFVSFRPHRIGLALDARRLRRVGLVAIGREYDVDLACSRVALYR